MHRNSSIFRYLQGVLFKSIYEILKAVDEPWGILFDLLSLHITTKTNEGVLEMIKTIFLFNILVIKRAS